MSLKPERIQRKLNAESQLPEAAQGSWEEQPAWRVERPRLIRDYHFLGSRGGLCTLCVGGGGGGYVGFAKM